MIWFLISAGAAVLGAVCLGIYWTEIRDDVASWLRQRNLNRSLLMDAWVEIDNFLVSVRSRIFVKTHDRRIETIEEKVLTLDEIDDPEVREALLKSRHYRKNIMELIE